MSALKKQVMIDHTYDVQGAVNDGYTLLQELGEEMRSWYDNMPENFQNADKGQTIEQAADALESINEANTPEVIQNLDCSFQTRASKRKSRASRRDEAVAILQSAKDAAETWMEENEKHEQLGEVEAFVSELDDMISEAESVEFPGMF